MFGEISLSLDHCLTSVDESVVNHPLPCESYQSFKIFEFSTSDFGTVSMRRQLCTSACEFLSTVTEGVVHGVHKVAIQSFFGVIWQNKVN